MDEIEELVKKGDSNLQKEKYMDAIREYSKAYELIQNNEDEATAELSYKLSQAYYALNNKNTEYSRKFGEISLKIHENLGEIELQVMDLINIGYIEMDANHNEDAKSYFDQAIERAKGIEDTILIDLALLAKADLLSKSKSKREEAFKIYEEVLGRSREAEDWDNYFEALRGKISIMRSNGEEEEALQISLESLDLIDKITNTIKNKKEKKGFRNSLAYIYDIASDIAMELQDVEQAIKIAQRLEQ